MEDKKLVIKTVRFSKDLNAELVRAAKKLEIAEQDALRLALKIGLACLEKTGYDIPEQIADKALSK